MKPIYYCVEYFKDGTEHKMRIGKQLKRAKDTAERMLRNNLVSMVEVVYYTARGETSRVLVFPLVK